MTEHVEGMSESRRKTIAKVLYCDFYWLLFLRMLLGIAKIALSANSWVELVGEI